MIQLSISGWPENVSVSYKWPINDFHLRGLACLTWAGSCPREQLLQPAFSGKFRPRFLLLWWTNSLHFYPRHTFDTLPSTLACPSWPWQSPLRSFAAKPGPIPCQWRPDQSIGYYFYGHLWHTWKLSMGACLSVAIRPASMVDLKEVEMKKPLKIHDVSTTCWEKCLLVWFNSFLDWVSSTKMLKTMSRVSAFPMLDLGC